MICDDEFQLNLKCEKLTVNELCLKRIKNHQKLSSNSVANTASNTYIHYNPITAKPFKMCRNILLLLNSRSKKTFNQGYIFFNSSSLFPPTVKTRVPFFPTSFPL